MKTIHTALVLCTLLSGVASAQSTAVPAAAKSEMAATAAAMTEGEVRKVDLENKKITLKHGEIKNLGMPPMAMVFQVNAAVPLDKLKVGDKVRFKAVYEAGKYVVTEIQPAK